MPKFFIKETIKSADMPIIICFSSTHTDRAAFLRELDRWNKLHDILSYQEVPISCVKKLFGRTDFEELHWPKDK